MFSICVVPFVILRHCITCRCYVSLNGVQYDDYEWGREEAKPQKYQPWQPVANGIGFVSLVTVVLTTSILCMSVSPSEVNAQTRMWCRIKWVEYKYNLQGSHRPFQWVPCPSNCNLGSRWQHSNRYECVSGQSLVQTLNCAVILRGFLEEKWYAMKVGSLLEVKAMIVQTFRTISEDLCRKSNYTQGFVLRQNRGLAEYTQHWEHISLSLCFCS